MKRQNEWLGIGIHELAHTFGANGHCTSASGVCVMALNSVWGQIERGEAIRNGRRDVFCNLCFSRLENYILGHY